MLPCSRYSGTDLTEKVPGSSICPRVLPGGTGNENNEEMKRVDACLQKSHVQLYKKSIQTFVKVKL